MEFSLEAKLILTVPKADKTQLGTSLSYEDIISEVCSELGQLPDIEVDAIPANYKTTEHTNITKLRIYNISITATLQSGDEKELTSIFKTIHDTAMNEGSVSKCKIKFSDLVYFWEELEFTAKRLSGSFNRDKSEVNMNSKFSGHISEEKINEFEQSGVLGSESVEEFIDYLKGSWKREDIVEQIDDEKTRANFLFIRSLLDYSNIAPSESFVSKMLEIYEKYPFMYQPYSKKWDRLYDLDEQERINFLSIILIEFTGLFRRDFKEVVSDWENMIRFLRDECDGDAKNFYKSTCRILDIDSDRDDALETAQRTLERIDNDVKERLGMDFSYGLKNGRLLITLLTENRRGYGLLEGVSGDKLKQFDLPVDAQVIRVSINTGLVEIDWVEDNTLELEGESSSGIKIKREEFEEVPQRAWREVAESTDRFPVELDYLVWTIGSTLGKRLGQFCFACPIRDVCRAWEERKVRESGGTDWTKHTYSFARNVTNIDGFILRDDSSEGYEVETFLESGEEFQISRIDEVLEGK